MDLKNTSLKQRSETIATAFRVTTIRTRSESTTIQEVFRGKQRASFTRPSTATSANDPANIAFCGITVTFVQRKNSHNTYYICICICEFQNSNPMSNFAVSFDVWVQSKMVVSSGVVRGYVCYNNEVLVWTLRKALKASHRYYCCIAKLMFNSLSKRAVNFLSFSFRLLLLF